MFSKRKIHTDIVCHLSNPEQFTPLEINLWDGIMEHEKKIMVKSFVVGSIRIYSSNNIFFYNANMELGDKIYNLHHYLLEGQTNEAAIYNFEKGWLAPLNIPLSFDKKIMLNIPPSTSVRVSISTVW